MRNISTPVDFTETSRLAIKYTCAIAEKAGANIQLFHIVEPDQAEENERIPDIESVKSKLREFSDVDNLCTTNYEIIVESGNFSELIPDLLRKHDSDLAIIGTHGVKGIFQTMRGADVLKLIQHIGVPSLIVQRHSSLYLAGFDKILFPIASHKNWEVKVNQTMDLARLFNSKILVYVLYPENGQLDEQLEQNLQKTTGILEERGADFEVVKEASKVYGVGYAKQAMEYAYQNDIQLFSIMAHASSDHSYFGNVERTQFILNEKGIPVLCCSE